MENAQVVDKQRLIQFASDNTAGCCPEAWQALQEANSGFARPYGNDEQTAQAADALREFFEYDCDVYFCFNGTAANSMALAHICRPFHSVIAHRAAHIENDECGGPEFFSHGSKLLLGGGPDGKLTPQDVSEIVGKRSDIHFPKPKVISLTQSTELGTCYTARELRALHSRAQEYGLKLHMDGARFANALAHLQVSPKEITWQVGVDVLCFGATKNGFPVGDAVVFFNRELAQEFDYRCKQAGQLASKMRFLTAPYASMLKSGVWLKNAEHANRQAARLAQELALLPGFRLIRPQEVNAVFLEIAPGTLERLRKSGVAAYDFIGGGVRLMCSWNTSDADLNLLIEMAKRAARD